MEQLSTIRTTVLEDINQELNTTHASLLSAMSELLSQEVSLEAFVSAFRLHIEASASKEVAASFTDEQLALAIEQEEVEVTPPVAREEEEEQPSEEEYDEETGVGCQCRECQMGYVPELWFSNR